MTRQFDERSRFSTGTFEMTSKSGVGHGPPAPILHRKEISIVPVEIQPRFFQKQTAVEGNCAVCSFNNAVGARLITNLMVKEAFRAEKALFESSLDDCSIPGKREKLLSITLLEKLARRVGYSLSKIRNFRQPKDLFDWILKQTSGRFLLLTATDNEAQARDGHDLTARNYRHWVALSADENLIIDSLARTLGPQTLSVATLQRSIRHGILRIYKINAARLSCKLPEPFRDDLA